ncbi:polarity establishment/cellular polarization [Gnomoniopsis smithogilvyi]|uniref:Polarity establishment/cellular polarization n=1 Tax=Gnomoniopsis smithogilvyi TaxID=1191159 RepID=A0A9W9D0H0_9PEZI|nr:polarity establishment/cellular polarization [Gnomoniopsis smithogilvyi]
MPSAGRILLLSALSRAVLVQTAPTLSFPINSQVPPVARTGEYFSFIFSDSTFTASDGSSLSYSLTDPPSWLSLDSGSRTLIGTPQDADIAAGTVVGVNITLTAIDSLGETADDATLVVSRNPAPSVQIPISDQIQTFGNYSEPSSILCSPEEDFKFIFESDTFVDADAAVLSYYSVMIDNSPLPAWLSFDAGALTFAGTTPPISSLIQPPQTFAVKLIASDVTGFSATSVNFSIVVGSHTLTTSQPEVILNATAGEPLLYTGLVGSIEIDGQVAQPAQVNATTQGLPAWLSFDPASWQFSGTPPDTAESTTFTIIMQDTYADLLNITVILQLTDSDSLFQATFPALTVTPGSSFSFDLSSYLLDPDDLDVTSSIQPATSWISWDAITLTLSGDAPTSAQKSVVNVTFTAVSKTSTKAKRAGASQSQELIIQIDPAAESTSTSAIASSTNAPSSSASTAATSTATTASAGETSSQSHSIKWTVVAAVISVIAVIAIIGSLCFWYCSRRKNKRLSRSSSEPYPESTFIHTPGHAVGSPELHNASSSNEKEKGTKATTIWKASSLRREVKPPSSAPAGFGFGALYNDDQPSVVSTPRGKIHDWFASMKSLRVVHVLPANRRMSTDSSLPDEGRSHHGFDLESSGPPFITLSHGSQTSFRDALEVSLPAQDSSVQLTPDAVYSADRRRKSRRISKGKPITGASDGTQKQDPFTDIHVVDSISPISEHNPDPESSKAQHISPLTPTEPGPSFPIPSSSTLPTTRPLRPANSQKSFASSASSSIDSLRGHSNKFARKASAHAKGAIFALQSPKRRTYAALGKRRSAGKRKRRTPVLEDDESAITGVARSVSSPAPSTSKPGSRSGGGGIAGFLSPRVWPQPGGRNITVPQTQAEAAGALGDINERSPIRRRPVPGRRDTEQSLSGYSATDSIVMPSPLRTPVRSGNSKNYSKASPYGLGILDVCNEIADSSPYGPSSNSMVSGSASAERNWELIAESPISKNREEVGRALGGEEMDSPVGASRRKSVAGVSEKSKGSSGLAAFV